MTILEFIASLLGALAWPATLLVIFFVLRKQIVALLPFLEHLKYKDLELSFRTEAEEALQSIESAAPTTVEHAALQNINPRAAVLDAWKRLEITAEEKLESLNDSRAKTRLGADRALGFFEYMGALLPRTRQALTKLRMLRHQASHYPNAAISVEGATAYVNAADSIAKQILALAYLPQIKLNKLTYLILEYNHLLDTGRYDHITIDDVHREISSGSVLRYVAKIAANDVDLSLYLDGVDEFGFEEQYSKRLQAIYGGYAGRERKWGVEKLGLCLLVAWTNEIIQQGSGWYPNEDVAGLNA